MRTGVENIFKLVQLVFETPVVNNMLDLLIETRDQYPEVLGKNNFLFLDNV